MSEAAHAVTHFPSPRIYVLSYLSFLIFRRVEILKDLDSGAYRGRLTVADNATEITRKAILYMFEDPGILDGKIVIGFFSAVLCLGTMAQLIAILKISGCFLKKRKHSTERHKTHHFKRSQKVIVNIHGRYAVGIVQAHNAESDTVHIVFSDRDADKIESDIEISSTVEDLVAISEHISCVSSAQIKAHGTNVTALKKLLREQLQNRSVRADHVHPSLGIGLFKKLQLRFSKLFKVIERARKSLYLSRFSKHVSNPPSQSVY